MNLCGGAVPVSEPEQLLLEIPDDKFQLTPRRKASSSAPSRNRKGIPNQIETGDNKSRSTSRPSSYRHSNSMPPSPTFLNPISKQDLKKSKSRQRSLGPPLHRVKTNTGVIKKLEDGFNLTFLACDKSRRSVVLLVDPSKSYLRVRQGDENNSDNENDGFTSNCSDIRIKVHEISRVEVGRDKLTQKGGSNPPKPGLPFSIVAKRSSGESNAFTFEAESVVDRESVIAAIKGLLEYSKISMDARRRKVPSPSPHVADPIRRPNNVSSSSKRDKHNVSQNSLKSEVLQTPNTPSEGGLETRAIYFDFDLSKEGGGEGKTCFHDKKNEKPDSERGSGKNGKEMSKSRDLISTAESKFVKDVTVEVTGKNWSLDEILCRGKKSKSKSRNQHQSISDVSGNQATPRKQERAMKEINSYLYDKLSCQAFACQSQALAAVEDVELAMAANGSDEPWCTDDVFTTSLKDFADTMKGIFELKQKSRNVNRNKAEKEVMADDYITGVFGASTAMGSLLSNKETWDKQGNPAPRKKRLVNRSRCIGAQAARLNHLRKQMNFQESSVSEKMPFVQIISSFDDIERGGRFTRKPSSAELAKNIKNDPSAFLKNVVENMTAEEPVSEFDDELLYYDSDPDDARERALSRGPRRAIADRINQSKKAKTERKEALSGIPMTRLNLGRRWKRMDDDVIMDIIETMKNEKMTLIWHPTQTDSNQNRTPMCAKVWIESGTYLIDGTFLLPKLAWVPAFESVLQSKILNVTLNNPGTVDLLDVCRVRECEKINRSIHPFARVDCSFIVQTQKQTHLFEAQSKEERGRIVNGLRLVIARLASLLMLRDLRAVDEFFGGNTVPGEAPSWATNRNEKSSDPGDPSVIFPIGNGK